VDNVYLVTSQPYTDTPTAIIEVHDGSSTAEAIFGGTVTTTDANGISVTEGVDLQGGDTDDYIAGSAYADTIDGGAGNDEIVFDLLDSSIDGGTGNDTLLVTESGALDFSNVSNIETIDLTDGSAENITNISVQDVFDMTDDNNTLVINGDGGSDEVHLFNDGTKEWTAGTAEDIGGVTYDVYSYTDGIDTAVVKIQQDLTHDVQS
jgi:Ca2+-binding RTX toxin-like protein